MQNLSAPQFPNSFQDPFEITSPKTWDYNCIAWAVEENDAAYWPSPYPDQYDWPDDILFNTSIDAFIQFYETYGFEVCDNGNYNEDYIKIAIFAKNGETKHAARQLSDDLWTSKLGPSFDVKHSLKSMEGGEYGYVEQFMRKEVSLFQRAIRQ